MLALAMPDLTLIQFDSYNHQVRPSQIEHEPKLTVRSYLGYVNTGVTNRPVLSILVTLTAIESV